VKRTPVLFYALIPNAFAVHNTGQKQELQQIREKGIPSQMNKTFDKRNSVKVRTRRTKSSFGRKKEDNFMVVVNGAPITKIMILGLKKIYDLAAKNGDYSGIRLRAELLKRNFDNFGKIAAEKKYFSFKEFIEDLYHKADPGQVRRMLCLINCTKYLDMTPLPEKPKKAERKSKELRKIEKVFRKFDINGDGVIDINEMKSAMEPVFTERTIEELYKEHSRNPSGMHIEEFSEMFLSNAKK
jgi:Ca2+-binding EF-hand superfamily protein